MRARLADVAKMAGVAPNTASMILNKRPECWASKATKQRVFDAASQLDYRPSRAALGIRLGRFKAIGLILPDLYNPFYAHFADMFDRALREHDYLLVLENGRADIAYMKECQETILDRHIDAVCYFMADVKAHEAYLKRAAHMGKSVLAMAGPTDKPFKFDAVVTDFNNAINEATSHLVALGHKRFAFISSVPKGLDPGSRPALFSAGLIEKGIDPNAIDLVQCGYELSEVRESFRSYLEKKGPNRPTAALCLDDLTAIGAIKAIADLGLSVPKDFSIIGVNDIPIGDFLPQSLSTIAQPVAEMTAAAAELIVRRLSKEGKEAPPETRYFASRYIAKQTTAQQPKTIN